MGAASRGITTRKRHMPFHSHPRDERSVRSTHGGGVACRVARKYFDVFQDTVMNELSSRATFVVVDLLQHGNNNRPEAAALRRG